VSGHASAEERAVPSAKLHTSSPVGRWLAKSLANGANLRIPSLPLEEQPEPSRVTHIDADQRDCLGPIRNQKKCGACYAFSALSMVEWHYCKQTGEKVDLSEQFVVDCIKSARFGGCDAGLLPDTMDFITVFGVALEQEYPYEGKHMACRRKRGTIEVRVRQERLEFDRQDWERTLEEQPILVQVHLPEDIDGYMHGIHPGNNCSRERAHGMLLVGHGRQDGQAYWILRNSMGPKWGEAGYFRLSREAAPNCIRTGFIGRFKFKNVPENSYDQFYESLTHRPKTMPMYNEDKVKRKLGLRDIV